MTLADLPMGTPVQGTRLNGRGRVGTPLTLGSASSLGEEDLLSLHTADLGLVAPPLQKIRESHHALARLLADGVTPTDAGRLAGFCPSRVSILKKDPAFKDLISHYTAKKDEVLADLSLQFRTVMASALQELQERLLDDPAGVETKELLETVKLLADRSGMGPTSKIESTSVSLNIEAIQELKALVHEEQIGGVAPILEHAPISTITSDEGLVDGTPTPNPNGSSSENEGLPSELPGPDDTEPFTSGAIQEPLEQEESRQARVGRSEGAGI